LEIKLVLLILLLHLDTVEVSVLLHQVATTTQEHLPIRLHKSQMEVDCLLDAIADVPGSIVIFPDQLPLKSFERLVKTGF